MDVQSAARLLCCPGFGHQIKKANPCLLAASSPFPRHLPFPSPLPCFHCSTLLYVSYRQWLSLSKQKSLSGRLGIDRLASSHLVMREMDEPPPVPMCPTLYPSSVDLTYVDGCRSVRQPQPLELRPSPSDSISPSPPSSYLCLTPSCACAWGPWQSPVPAPGRG